MTYPHNQPLDRIESDYRQGICTQVEYEQYCFVWRNSCYKFSTNLASYHSEEHYLKPLDELVTIAEKLYS